MRHRKKLYEWVWKDRLHRESRIASKQIKYGLSLSSIQICAAHAVSMWLHTS
ncbi:hypothetical protein BGW80DRAFT_1304347 [Lactifluus volemus]|nr:hypothetical protein BGW80DRAFT_1304347 [Lactifluus volemus]